MQDGTVDTARNTSFPWEPGSLENSVSASFISALQTQAGMAWVVVSSTWQRDVRECVFVYTCTHQQELGQQFARYLRN